MLLNIWDFFFFFFGKLASPLEKVTSPFQQPVSHSWSPVKPPLFETLVRSSNSPPFRHAERGLYTMIIQYISIYLVSEFSRLFFWHCKDGLNSNIYYGRNIYWYKGYILTLIFFIKWLFSISMLLNKCQILLNKCMCKWQTLGDAPHLHKWNKVYHHPIQLSIKSIITTCLDFLLETLKYWVGVQQG